MISYVWMGPTADPTYYRLWPPLVTPLKMKLGPTDGPHYDSQPRFLAPLLGPTSWPQFLPPVLGPTSTTIQPYCIHGITPMHVHTPQSWVQSADVDSELGVPLP